MQIAEISKSELNKAFKDMIDKALAIAIVTKDGQVAYNYAGAGKICYNVSDAAAIISVIAKLSDDYSE